MSPSVARALTRWLLALHGARSVPLALAPGIHHIVDRLAERAGLSSTPRVYYLPSRSASAFTVGRGRDAAIAVSDGLLRSLDTRQLVGVLAHEISHIRNGDPAITSCSGLAGSVGDRVVSVGLWSVLLTLPLSLVVGPVPLLTSAVLVVLPGLLSLLQRPGSRDRELAADAGAVALTADPDGLAEGLETLSRARAVDLDDRVQRLRGSAPAAPVPAARWPRRTLQRH